MKIKVAIASLAVATVVVAAFAFKAPQAPVKKLAGQYFEYIGPQSNLAPASLSDARTRSNYQLVTSYTPQAGNGFLNAIFVDASEIDNMGTPDPSDDMPKVDESSTDIFTALDLAHDASLNSWSDVVNGTASVDADNQP